MTRPPLDIADHAGETLLPVHFRGRPFVAIGECDSPLKTISERWGHQWPRR